jgi:hypothetical protein
MIATTGEEPTKKSIAICVIVESAASITISYREIDEGLLDKH